jgi:hypothetical protein
VRAVATLFALLPFLSTAAEPCGSPENMPCPGQICGAHPRSEWDHDHALIAEEDLTYEATVQAEIDIARARDAAAAGIVSDLEMVRVGSERILEGYRLKLAYEAHPSDQAKQTFCSWMNSNAYWPE